MNRVTLWRISVGVLLFASAPALAQEHPAFSWPPPAGAKARLTWRNPDVPPVIVQVVSATSDTLRYVLRKDASVVSIGVNSLAQVDVSLERNSHVMQDAGIGFGIGALLGAAAGYSSANGPSEKRGYAILEGLVGGGMGFALGGVLGLFNRSDTWIPVALPTPAP
jgi:hypothetical protein